MIAYTHQTHSRAKSIKIKVDPTGKVIVVSPRFFPRIMIDSFVKKNIDWINKAKEQVTSKLNFGETSETIHIFGKEYQKNITKREHGPYDVRIDGQDFNLTSPIKKDSEKKHLERFLKNTATKYIIPRTHQLAKTMGIDFNRITLRQQKTRWGSCSSQGNLNFNWRLIHAPTAIIDYVIIHELAHRKQMNHSTAFWNLVTEYDPEWKKHRGWLKRHGMPVG